MATKQVGEFSLKPTSARFSPGPGGSIVAELNLEGTGTGLEVLVGTATFVSAGAKSGTFSWCGLGYLENGEVISGNSTGTFESIGRNKWRTRGISHLPDGRAGASEGEFDFAARSWTGKFFDAS